MNIEAYLSSVVKKDVNIRILSRAICKSKRPLDHLINWITLYLNEKGRRRVNIEECATHIVNDTLWCALAMYDSAKELEAELWNFLHHPVKLERGVMKCVKCGSEYVLSHQIQTRSNDETATTVNTCADCGAHWRYSG